MVPQEKLKIYKDRTYTRENLKLAVKKILNENLSIRSVALMYKIPRMTLQRYLQKAKETKDVENISFGRRNEHLRILQDSDEILLRDFFLYASKINHGLNIKEGRRFVYEFAVAKNLPINVRWKEEKMAPYDWFYCFMRRHDLSLQTPEEATKICLNEKAHTFFENLRDLLERYQSKAQILYRKNGSNSLSKPFKVIAQKGR